MVSIANAKKIALAFEEAQEQPHFDILSFRVKKKIFITINPKENRACLRFTPFDQDIFTKINKECFYAVPNKWGTYGWTLVNLKKVPLSLFNDAITCAYCNAAPPKLADKYKFTDEL